MSSYHDDPHGPSLSSSIARLLVERSPLHAWTAHPRLNPDWTPRHEEKFDLGTVVHALLLEGDSSRVRWLPFADWRLATAREQRDEARARGLVPLLEANRERVEGMLSAVRAGLEAIAAHPPLLQSGEPEVVLEWEEDDVKLRAKLDWLHLSPPAIDDLKTTSRSAAPESYARSLYGTGGDIQAAFYVRGLRAVYSHPEDARFRWIVCETEPPYAVSAIEPGPDVLAVGESKVEWAINRWRELMADPVGPWPGYPAEVHRAELPAWEEARWLERMGAEG